MFYVFLAVRNRRQLLVVPHATRKVKTVVSTIQCLSGSQQVRYHDDPPLALPIFIKLVKDGLPFDDVASRLVVQELTMQSSHHVLSLATMMIQRLHHLVRFYFREVQITGLLLVE
jgi:hypothetical protein